MLALVRSHSRSKPESIDCDMHEWADVVPEFAELIAEVAMGEQLHFCGVVLMTC